VESVLFAASADDRAKFKELTRLLAKALDKEGALSALNSGATDPAGFVAALA